MTSSYYLFGLIVSGVAKPGELMAIMGASGSGKTTLLDVLNFRNQMKISGEVSLNGRVIQSEKALSFLSAYVTQQDLFFDTLTVKEHLTFHVICIYNNKYSVLNLSIIILQKAMLRLKSSLSNQDRLARIESVLNDVSK